MFFFYNSSNCVKKNGSAVIDTVHLVGRRATNACPAGAGLFLVSLQASQADRPGCTVSMAGLSGLLMNSNSVFEKQIILRQKNCTLASKPVCFRCVIVLDLFPQSASVSAADRVSSVCLKFQERHCATVKRPGRLATSVLCSSIVLLLVCNNQLLHGQEVSCVIP